MNLGAAGRRPRDHRAVRRKCRDRRLARRTKVAALEWTVDGILPEGMGLLVAPPKAGKSWMVANVALACAAGGRHSARSRSEKRPVLYLAFGGWTSAVAEPLPHPHGRAAAARRAGGGRPRIIDRSSGHRRRVPTPTPTRRPMRRDHRHLRKSQAARASTKIPTGRLSSSAAF